MAEEANPTPEKKVTFRNWLALSGVMLGAFMAVLDIQITNSSLNDISGALGSSVDEGSWISTAYLVAEIVAIGISGIMAEIFSLKRYLDFQRHRLPDLLGALRLFHGLESDDFVSGLPGHHRRRADSAGVQCHPDAPASFQTTHWHGDLRPDRDVRPFHRPDDWRLADRQLRLAVDLLH